MKKFLSITIQSALRIMFLIICLLSVTETKAQQLKLTEEEWDELREITRESCLLMANALQEQTTDETAAQLLPDGIGGDCFCSITASYLVKELKKELSNRNISSEEELMDILWKLYHNIFDENSEEYNEHMYEVYKTCANNSSEIKVKGPPFASIPLTVTGTMSKVKITIGSSSKYYLLDSGATECFISDSYAFELYMDGIITDNSFLESQYYTLADGSYVLCERVQINNVKIGNYTLDNVVFCIAESDIVFLCGKNVLNVFGTWKINNNKSILEVTK
jgi:hypothetical protein